MILILIGNKRGKGNGKRIVLDYPEPFSPNSTTDEVFFNQFNSLADSCEKIRIQIGQEWACKFCKVVSITARNAHQCPACKKRKPSVSNEVIRTDKGIDLDKTLGTDLDAQMKSDMITAGYCDVCWKKRVDCLCQE